MKKRLFVATLAIAALAPLGAAHANGGVVVSVSTPQFGFRIGSPFYGPPVYAPVYAPPPVFVPAPVIVSPPVYGPPVVMIPSPRVFYPAPVVVGPPPMAFPPAFIPRPRVVYPRVAPRPLYGPPVQQAGYWVSSGHGRHYDGRHYQ
jgi:hypothetical protein